MKPEPTVIERDGFRLVIAPRDRSVASEGIIDLTLEHVTEDTLGIKKWDVVGTHMLAPIEDSVHRWRDHGHDVTAMFMLLMPDQPWSRTPNGTSLGPIKITKARA